MITEKEKIVLEIIFEEYKKDKNSDKSYMKSDELVNKSHGRLVLPDLHSLILSGHSQYIYFRASDTLVGITPTGIAYMEGKKGRILKDIAFWIFGLSAILAALYAALTYYFK